MSKVPIAFVSLAICVANFCFVLIWWKYAQSWTNCFLFFKPIFTRSDWPKTIAANWIAYYLDIRHRTIGKKQRSIQLRFITSLLRGIGVWNWRGALRETKKKRSDTTTNVFSKLKMGPSPHWCLHQTVRCLVSVRHFTRDYPKLSQKRGKLTSQWQLASSGRKSVSPLSARCCGASAGQGRESPATWMTLNWPIKLKSVERNDLAINTKNKNFKNLIYFIPNLFNLLLTLFVL